MEQIGKYKVLRELGSGGFGSVYLAEDPKLGTKVAIKVFKIREENLAGVATSASQDASSVLKERFLSEARTLEELSHNPYIVNIKEYDELADGTPYYVMPYLPNSLESEIGKDAFTRGKLEETPKELHPKKLPSQRAIEILKQTLEAMSAVHRAGLVHRDIKPANILFDSIGNVQVCDFGIAKLPDAEYSQSGIAMGSRNYMSPEQRESAKHVTAASDVYSLGVLAYRIFTGQMPSLPYQPILAYAPDVGKPLSNLIDQSISQQELSRPQNATEMLLKFNDSLKSVIEGIADDSTGTWVEESNTEIKTELKPLKDKIIHLLQSQGEIKDSDVMILQALADIGQLDQAGLDALVSTTKDEQAKDPQQAAFQSWVESVNKAALQNLLEDAKKTAFLEAGLTSTGRDKALLEGILEEKSTDKKSVGQKSDGTSESGSNSKSPVQAEQSSSGIREWLSIAAVIAILGGGSFYGYDTYQKEQKAQLQAQIDQEAEQRAWNEAEQLNTIEAYEQYLIAWPNGRYQQKAESTRGQLKERARLAKLNEAQFQQLQVKRAQNLLQQLDYQVSDTGDLDTRTKKAIEIFEQSQKLMVTGTVDDVLIDNLEKVVVQKQDDGAWQEARNANTVEAYQGYLTQQPQGLYRSEAGKAIENIRQESNKVALIINATPADAKVQILDIKDEYKPGMRLEPGEYKIKVSKAGYQEHTGAFLLSENDNRFSITLQSHRPEAKTYNLRGTSFTLKGIPHGTFKMGSNYGHSHEKPVRSVSIDAFMLMEHEVTWAMYQPCIDAGACLNASDGGWGKGNRPVIEVSWNDITKHFIPWLNEQTGQQFRLPSEAEWEYAARAGSTTNYNWGDDIGHNNANCDGCGSQWDNSKTAPVKSFQPNAFGLYDMHGNVWEWTLDCWNDSYIGAPINGVAWVSGNCDRRMMRGGSWLLDPSTVRSAFRGGYDLTLRFNNSGFRLALDAEIKANADDEWVIHLGTFANKLNADALNEILKNAGYQVFVNRKPRSSTFLHTVFIGPFGNRSEAIRISKEASELTKLNGKIEKYRRSQTE